ncbi:MAG: energy-coupling factor ABC transporter ATP-binding protein [Candidatus Bathyarchaeia archaeon]
MRDVSVSLGLGEVVAVIGRNGSGKTTLAKVLAGMFKPTTGQLFIDGNDYRKFSVAEIGRKVGYVFQNFDYQLFSDTVANEVTFGLKNMGLPEPEIQTRIDETLTKLGLEHYRGVHPRRLSSGQRQAVAIASVLAMKPNAVILDEPTTGQDQKRTKQIMQLIQQMQTEGKLVIIISHNIGNIASYCKRVIALNGGQIVADGPTQEILGNKALLKQIHFKPTPIMQLSELLNGNGCHSNVFSVTEMAQFIKEHVRSKQK